MKRLIPLLPLLVATAAGAQTRHDTNAPIDFGANQIQLQDKANRAVLTGNVAVKQAEMTLNAQRVTVAYTGQVVDGNPQVSRLDAAGNVVVRRPNQIAKSQYAVYDLNRRIITMIGAVSLEQGGANTVNGGRLTINLDSGRGDRRFHRRGRQQPGARRHRLDLALGPGDGHLLGAETRAIGQAARHARQQELIDL